MTPETEGSSVTRPEIGAGFAGIFELLEAPDYRLAQHGPHTPSVPKGGSSWQNREIATGIRSGIPFGIRIVYQNVYQQVYQRQKEKRYKDAPLPSCIQF